MTVVELQVNGIRYRVEVDANRTLLNGLRDELDSIGGQYGCGDSQCGACTVLLDGRAVRSCTVPTNSVEDHSSITVEGLEQNGCLHPLQQALLAVDPGCCR